VNSVCRHERLECLAGQGDVDAVKKSALSDQYSVSIVSLDEGDVGGVVSRIYSEIFDVLDVAGVLSYAEASKSDATESVRVLEVGEGTFPLVAATIEARKFSHDTVGMLSSMKGRTVSLRIICMQEAGAVLELFLPSSMPVSTLKGETD
jgi:hypothetical protein